MKKFLWILAILGLLFFVTSCGKVSEDKQVEVDSKVTEQLDNKKDLIIDDKRENKSIQKKNSSLVAIDIQKQEIKKIDREIQTLQEKRNNFQSERDKLQDELEEEKQEDIELYGVWKERVIDDGKIVEKEQEIDAKIQGLNSEKKRITDRIQDIKDMQIRIDAIITSKTLTKFSDEKLGLSFEYPEAWGEVKLNIYDSEGYGESGTNIPTDKKRSFVEFENFPEIVLNIKDIGYVDAMGNIFSEKDYKNYKTRNTDQILENQLYFGGLKLGVKDFDKYDLIYYYSSFFENFSIGKVYSIYLKGLSNKSLIVEHYLFNSPIFIYSFIPEELYFDYKKYSESVNVANENENTFARDYAEKLYEYITSEKMDPRYSTIENQIEEFINSIQVLEK